MTAIKYDNSNQSVGNPLMTFPMYFTHMCAHTIYIYIYVRIHTCLCTYIYMHTYTCKCVQVLSKLMQQASLVSNSIENKCLSLHSFYQAGTGESAIGFRVIWLANRPKFQSIFNSIPCMCTLTITDYKPARTVKI